METEKELTGYPSIDKPWLKYYSEEALSMGSIWACTGDMGYVSEEGSIFIDGRISSSYVNSIGETIYLFDIERTVLDIDEIRQCKAVVSEINGVKTHVIHIVLVQNDDINSVLSSMKKHCEEKLPTNHIPSLAKIYDDALPVAPSGKLDVIKMEKDIQNIIML